MAAQSIWHSLGCCFNLTRTSGWNSMCVCCCCLCAAWSVVQLFAQILARPNCGTLRGAWAGRYAASKSKHSVKKRCEHEENDDVVYPTAYRNTNCTTSLWFIQFVIHSPKNKNRSALALKRCTMTMLAEARRPGWPLS